MAKSKFYTLMLEFEEGGTIKPIPWSKEHLALDSIVFVINEDSQAVYVWIGKKNSLVKRRTALRQGDSLKGHGFQIGKSVVGRGVTQIFEIDDRKVGSDPEATKNNEKFMALFEQPFQVAMGEVVVLGAEGETVEEEEIPVPTPKPVAVAKSRLTVKVAPPPLEEEILPAEEEIATDEEPTEISEKMATPALAKAPHAASKLKTPMVKATESVPPADNGLLKMGLVILSILTQVPDVYISRKKGETFEVESAEGVICRFKQEGDEVQFTEDSFERLDASKKKAIQEWYLTKVKEL